MRRSGPPGVRGSRSPTVIGRSDHGGLSVSRHAKRTALAPTDTPRTDVMAPTITVRSRVARTEQAELGAADDRGSRCARRSVPCPFGVAFRISSQLRVSRGDLANADTGTVRRSTVGSTVNSTSPRDRKSGTGCAHPPRLSTAPSIGARDRDRPGVRARPGPRRRGARDVGATCGRDGGSGPAGGRTTRFGAGPVRFWELCCLQ